MASTFSHLKIPLEKIQRATNNFADENIIGKGGFGNVYKGKLVSPHGYRDIAARRLDRSRGQGDVEFWTEISALSSLKHTYIFELIGYVDEKDEKIIINRHYPKGSLVNYLSDPTLTWRERLSISFDLGKAILYMHHGLKQGYYIIHRNINSSTILLESHPVVSWIPRLSGFEFSIKHSVERRSQIFLCDEAIGIKGYTDPADLKQGGVTHKSDVYSFGVVLFELLCGRKAIEKDNKSLASLSKFHYENGTLAEIIHADLWKQMDLKSFKCFSEAAYSCLEEERARRPNMEQVVDKLGEAYRFSTKVGYGEHYEYKKHEEHENDINNEKDVEDESNTNDEDEDDDNENYEDEHSFHKETVYKVAGFEVKVILAYFEFMENKLVKDIGILSRATHLLYFIKTYHLYLCI